MRETSAKRPAGRALLFSRVGELKEGLRDFAERVKREPSVRLMAVLGGVVFVLGVGVWMVERAAAVRGKLDPSAPAIKSFGQALYWMFITGTTTGYGDLIPHTPLGRGLTVALILLSMVFTSILTATIASWFVEKRILEGKGMDKIVWKGHIVICGWNENAASIVEGIYRETKDGAKLVLVNNLPEDEISDILYRFRRQGLRFVRGDFVHENVLERANVAQADTVVILAERAWEGGYARTDERTALAALAVKSMNPQVRVCAELVNKESVSHLKRAQVDHIIVFGEHEDFFLASAVTAPGVTVALQELLNPARGSLIQQWRVPGQFVGKEVRELALHLKQRHSALLIGVVSEEKRGVTLDDLLSEDMSAIDLFLKRQFEGIEEDYFYKGRAWKVRLNPPDEYKLQKNDFALLIAEPEAEPGPGGGTGP